MSAEIRMHFDPSVFALGDKVCLQLWPHLTDLLYIRAISSGDPLRPLGWEDTKWRLKAVIFISQLTSIYQRLRGSPSLRCGSVAARLHH